MDHLQQLARSASPAHGLEPPSVWRTEPEPEAALEGISEVSAPRLALTDLIALTKPGITWMIVLTTGVGLFMAPDRVPLATIALAIFGTALIVSAANTLNCWIEREPDGLMSRTRLRPLPAGRLDPDHALWLGLGLAVISVPLLTFGVNPLTGLLSFLALVSYVLVYTPLKRVTPLSTLVGAVPGALPALIGWTAATGRLDPEGLVLFGILFLWQVPHFLAIGLFRRRDYERGGFRIMPTVYGERATRLQMAGFAGLLVPVSLLLVPLHAAGVIYLVGAAVLGVAFFALAARGALTRVGTHWAKQAFFGSLVYLVGLYALLALDRLLA